MTSKSNKCIRDKCKIFTNLVQRRRSYGTYFFKMFFKIPLCLHEIKSIVLCGRHYRLGCSVSHLSNCCWGINNFGLLGRVKLVHYILLNARLLSPYDRSCLRKLSKNCENRGVSFNSFIDSDENSFTHAQSYGMTIIIVTYKHSSIIKTILQNNFIDKM